ncbi:triple tyrosine motif-containing protein [Flavobacterium sp. DGU11]|uniref:Triple tyrosine motif-containing protein n=1 Tax=Flavobacterium arundinis TaxID=3139143 RepID=A0ABU9HYF4_9FLAO
MLFLAVYQGHAQVKHIGLPKIINYKKSDYSGGSQNWDIAQDKRGNLYFANSGGLIQFNGTSWSRTAIPNNTIRSIKIAESGKIYVGGNNEFGYYDIDQKGNLAYHSISKLLSPNSKKFMDFVWKVHILNDEVFFQTFNRTYIYRNNKLTILEAPNRFQFSFVADNKLYFQDISAGLMEYNNGRLIPLKGTQAFNDTEIWGLLPLSASRQLVITMDKGLFVYENGKVSPWNCEANTFVLKNNSLGGKLLNNNFIVLNSVLDGIIICDLDGKIVQHINNKKGLQNNTALSSFVDANNNLWLGLDNGIAFINENSPFTYLGSSYDLSTVYASALFHDNLYVATNQGVFYHDWTKVFKEESFRFIEGTTGQAWNLQEVDGDLFCLHNRGIFTISNGKAGKFLDDRGYLGLKKIPGMPGYLIGANYHGFAIFEKTPSGWTFKNQIEGLNMSDAKFTTDGKNIWLIRDRVAYQMKLTSDMERFSVIATHDNLNDKLKGITSVQQINNIVYFQTDNRFFTYSQSGDNFIEDKKMSALFKSIPRIRNCFEDKIGNICYFYGDSSMGMLIKQLNGGYKNVLSPFSTLTGDLVYYFESINAIDNANFFIGLTEGLAHYDPQLQHISTFEPKAFIRSFSFPGDTLITGNMDRINEITIPYRSNNVKFTFSSPIYDNPENIKFSYKLKGFDDKWSSWTRVPVKEYTNLQEGDYQMQVKVINSYGVVSKPVLLSFTVSPPFYRHVLAYFFYVFLVAFSIFYVRRNTKMKIRKNKYYETMEQRRLYLEKETKIRQEQLELEKEIERLKNEQLKVKILTKDKELVNNSLQVVKKNKVLNDIIQKLKDIDPETMDEGAKSRFSKLHKTIAKEISSDKSWNNLEKHIRNVHFDFLKRLKEKFPSITPREMDLATYLLMNMSTKEIAEIMNISDGGVELARYRLRKKLELSRKENLTGFLMSI